MCALRYMGTVKEDYLNEPESDPSPFCKKKKMAQARPEWTRRACRPLIWGVTVRVLYRTVHGQITNGSDHPYARPNPFERQRPWSGDFGVSRACACHYVAVWNALGKGSDIISSSSAGMFPWQRSTVSVSRCRCFNGINVFLLLLA